MVDTNLDFGQVIRDVHVPADHALNVDVNSSAENPIFVETTTGSTTIRYTFAVPFGSIPPSSGSTFQLVASTGENLSQFIPYDTTGAAIGLYTGASGVETLLCNMGPGYDVPTNVLIPAGTRVSIKCLNNSSPSSGVFYMQLIG